MSQIYIAGPIRGRANNNEEAFDRAHRHLAALQWINVKGEYKRIEKIYNPIQMAREALDDHLDSSNHAVQRMYAHRDIDAILKCEAIYMLKGWECSVGARAEHAVAVWIGLEIIYQ